MAGRNPSVAGGNLPEVGRNLSITGRNLSEAGGNLSIAERNLPVIGKPNFFVKCAPDRLPRPIFPAVNPQPK
jgi:hypothetical protein